MFTLCFLVEVDQTTMKGSISEPGPSFLRERPYMRKGVWLNLLPRHGRRNSGAEPGILREHWFNTIAVLMPWSLGFTMTSATVVCSTNTHTHVFRKARFQPPAASQY